MSSRAVFLLLLVYIAYDALDSPPSRVSQSPRDAADFVTAKINQLKSGQTDLATNTTTAARSGAFHLNTTALFKGRYTPHDLLLDPYSSSHLSSVRGSFDWSSPGALSFHLFDDHTFTNSTAREAVSFVDGIARIKVPGRKDISYRSAKKKGNAGKVITQRRSRVLSVAVAGFHFLSEGRIYLVGLANGNTSTTAMLDLALSLITNKDHYSLARSLVLSMYASELERLQHQIENDDETLEIVSQLTSDVKCQFNMVFELNSITKYSQSEMIEYEQDLIDSHGIPSTLPTIPPLSSAISIHSPNCRLKLTSRRALGTKIELFRRKCINYATALVWLTSSVQLCTLLTQMAHTSTPAKRANVSQTMVGVMVCYDAYLCFVHFMVGGVLGGDAYLAFAGASFVLFLGFAAFGLRYLLDLCKSRGNDGETSGGLGLLYSRFCTYLVAGIFFFYQFGASSPFIVTVTGVVMSSFWVPQIILNIQRNTRDALHPSFLLIHTISRLILPLYFLACPHNILTMTLLLDDPNYMLALALAIWICSQAGILVLQDRFGARVFIPEFLFPARHNYHPLLIFVGPQQSGSGQQRRLSIPTSKQHDTDILTVESRECAICFGDLSEEITALAAEEVRKKKKSQTSAAKIREKQRKLYMLTPCFHLFHSDCLGRWMLMKMECPVCRKELPPP